MAKNFDVVVIGGGPGGYIAAIRAAQLGFNVACIDEWKTQDGKPALGGTCTNVGCIPSKALLQSSEHFEHAGKHFAEHGITMTGMTLDVATMIRRKDTVVKQNNDGIQFLFKKNKVSFFHGRGSFAKAAEGGYEIKVAGAAEETITGTVTDDRFTISLPDFPTAPEQVTFRFYSVDTSGNMNSFAAGVTPELTVTLNPPPATLPRIQTGSFAASVVYGKDEFGANTYGYEGTWVNPDRSIYPEYQGVKIFWTKTRTSSDRKDLTGIVTEQKFKTSI